MRRSFLVAAILLAPVTGACAPGGGPTTPAAQGTATIPPATASASPTPPPVPAIVGRWEQVHHCQDLVSALAEAGLAATAPVAAGDFFPNETAEQLQHKADLCSGAAPVRHSHFFTAAGVFGSLDQDLNQVDDGQWEVVDAHTISINGSRFRYTIRGGDTLTLDPEITSSQRKLALADPLQFSTAAWMVAVAYPGTTWKRVPCESWC